MTLFAVVASRLFAAVEAGAGAVLLGGGLYLAVLGGSWYYAAAGAAMLWSAALIWRGRLRGVAILALSYAATVAWAIWEVGLAFWPLFPRTVAPTVLVIAGLLLVPLFPSRPRMAGVAALCCAALLAIGLGLFGYAGTQPWVLVGSSAPVAAAGEQPPPSDWTYYGRTAAGTRYAPFAEIDRDNVSRLEVAWTYRSGDRGPGEDQNVPLQIGSTLYSCSRNGIVSALDADTGVARWNRDAQARSPFWQRCRGLGYFDAASLPGRADKPALGAPCATRILQTTIDARLIAIDAASGHLCAGFGTDGVVDLGAHMGELKPGFYFQTSAPLVARNLIIVGGYVLDNAEVGEPSGVVRAFDALSGRLIWAWDLGDTAISGEPPAGATYTRGTPNMWSTASYDDRLGLVYLPIGNATPDYFGAERSDASERYSSSIVALDVETGRPRWSFQTVHHDLWDYDVAGQPALVDLPDGKGGIVPALLQTTKRGQLFLLDRTTGTPLTPIEERPVPQDGKVPEEWLAPTQPYQPAMPGIGTEPLSERRMWGATPLDQLWCRIRFRQLRYDGDFTPPGTSTSLKYPGSIGGLNWGGVSIDPRSGVAFMNDVRLPFEVQLLDREKSPDSERRSRVYGSGPQTGTPYGVQVRPMVSPLGIPCNEPPWGTVTAVDTASRSIAWQVALGTVADTRPFNALGLPFQIGMPTTGGTLATAGGLVFFAGSQDFRIRALDAATGRELWSAALPVGSSATPMTYVSPATGRQYIVISAGGAARSRTVGDFVIAFALPDS